MKKTFKKFEGTTLKKSDLSKIKGGKAGSDLSGVLQCKAGAGSDLLGHLQ